MPNRIDVGIINSLKLNFCNDTGLNTCTSSLSQEYKPMLVEGAVWNRAFYFESAIPFGFTIGADTILNNLTYNKVYNEFGSSLEALLREDTIERKVYLFEPNAPGQEELLYDFSLEVGDFFGDWRLDSISNELHVQFSEILTFNLDTRVFYFSLPSGSDIHTWIEGVGSSFGLLRASNAEHLLCHFDANGFLDVAINPEIIGVENCILLSTNNIPDLISGVLVPNPASSSLSLELQEYIQDGEVRI